MFSVTASSFCLSCMHFFFFSVFFKCLLSFSSATCRVLTVRKLGFHTRVQGSERRRWSMCVLYTAYQTVEFNCTTGYYSIWLVSWHHCSAGRCFCFVVFLRFDWMLFSCNQPVVSSHKQTVIWRGKKLDVFTWCQLQAKNLVLLKKTVMFLTISPKYPEKKMCLNRSWLCVRWSDQLWAQSQGCHFLYVFFVFVSLLKMC